MKKIMKKCTYPNALRYKYKQTAISIYKKDENVFLIETKRLLILSKKEVAGLKKFDSLTTYLEYRSHSKYAIWYNKIEVSSMAMACFHNAYNDLDKLIVPKNN